MRHSTLAALGLVLLSACGGSESEPTCSASDQDMVATVQVLPSAKTLVEGEQAQFRAIAYSCTGDPLPPPTFTWQTADGSMLTITPGGLAQAVKVGGPVGVTATAQGKVGSARVTIAARTVATVRVEPSAATVALGQTSQLVARALDSQGHELQGYTPAWSSSDEALATVSQSGLVTGVAVGGPVSVTATIEGRTGTAAITVVGEAVSSVEVTPPTSTLAGGATLQLATVLKDDEGNILTGRVVAWSTSDPMRAVVSSAGLVSGQSVTGPVTITATSEGKSGTAQVTITPAPPASLSFRTQPTSITAGGTIPSFQVEVLDVLGLPVSAPATITLEVLEGGTPDALHGTLTVAAVNGVATFSGIGVTLRSWYRLRAVSPGLADGFSKQFIVAPAPAVAISFLSQPQDAVVSEFFGGAGPTVGCMDPFDNWASPCGPITVSLGNNPTGATLGGKTTLGPTLGFMSFDVIIMDRPGVGYTMIASSPGLAPATSEPFDITAGTPHHMAFLVQPTSIVNGTAFDPVVVVEVQDYRGHRATTATGVVALTVRGPNDIGPPFGTTLVGTTYAYVSEGLAVFPGLSVTVSAERTLTLRAEMSGLTSKLSQAFVVRMF